MGTYVCPEMRIFQDIPSLWHFMAEENDDKADLGTVVGFDYALPSGNLE